MFVFPIFELWKILGQPYRNRLFSQTLLGFCWLCASTAERLADAVSLKKAYAATQDGLFRYDGECRSPGFQRFWRNYGPASPFYYVERFHPSLEFTLNPRDPDFAASVDDLIKRPS